MWKQKYRIMMRAGKFKIEKRTTDMRGEEYWEFFEQAHNIEAARDRVTQLKAADEPWVEVA